MKSLYFIMWDFLKVFFFLSLSYYIYIYMSINYKIVYEIKKNEIKIKTIELKKTPFYSIQDFDTIEIRSSSK